MSQSVKYFKGFLTTTLSMDQLQKEIPTPSLAPISDTEWPWGLSSLEQKGTDHPAYTPDVLPNLLLFTTQMQQCCSHQKEEAHLGEIMDLLIAQK